MNDGDFILKLVMGLNLLATLYLTFRKVNGASDRVSVTPQPLEVELTRQFATTKELEDFKKETLKRFERLEINLREDLREIVRKGDERALHIHERINSLGENLLTELSEVKGRCLAIHQKEVL